MAGMALCVGNGTSRSAAKLAYCCKGGRGILSSRLCIFSERPSNTVVFSVGAGGFCRASFYRSTQVLVLILVLVDYSLSFFYINRPL
uniref:Uncharacterized protein n=1 Tax=Anguilla anguilla TaxID=7936 RepID=A0A0E9QFX7_ANGAN